MPNLNINEILSLLRLLRKAYGEAALIRLVQATGVEPKNAAIAPIPAFKTADKLIADAGRLPPMLIENLLPDSSLFLLTGKPKAGKSFLALDIADCVCRGTPVLGTLPVSRRGPVLYLALEDGQQELARRLLQRGYTVSNTRPLGSPSVADNLYFLTDPINLTDPIQLARLKEQAEALQPSLIVIDTAAEALDIRDWINRSEILTKIAPIRRFAREICTILLVAHNRKAEGDMGDEIAGSNALAGAVDGWISAHRVERRANGNRRLFLRIEGRGGVGHELIAEMDHKTLKFDLIPPEQAETEAATARKGAFAARRDQRHALAQKALHNLGGHVTITELANAMGVSYRVAWSLIREMVALGTIQEVKPAQTQSPGGRAPTYQLTVSQIHPPT